MNAGTSHAVPSLLYPLTALSLVAIGGGLFMAVAAAQGADPRASFWIVVATVSSLAGVDQLIRRQRLTVLWAAIGMNIGIGVVALFSIGLGLLLMAGVCIVCAVIVSRTTSTPVVDARSLLAEVLCATTMYVIVSALLD